MLFFVGKKLYKKKIRQFSIFGGFCLFFFERILIYKLYNLYFCWSIIDLIKKVYRKPIKMLKKILHII